MLFIARFDDQPGRQYLRRAHQHSHDDYISKNQDRILVSGSLSRDDLGNPVGGLWYVDAKSRRDAEALCHGDPFWAAGLWKTVTLLPQQEPINSYANIRITCL